MYCSHVSHQKTDHGDFNPDVFVQCSYVDDIDSVDDIEKYSPPPILCLVEDSRKGKESTVSIGLIAISPSTGDVIWDEFSGKGLSTHGIHKPQPDLFHWR